MAAQNGVDKSGHSVARTILVMGAIGLLAAPFVSALVRRRTVRQDADKTDARVDKGLKDTFPASDPPAQHFTDIPINRQQ